MFPIKQKQYKILQVSIIFLLQYNIVFSYKGKQ